MGSQPRGISASRGAAVLGLSEFQTPLEVFQLIMEEREPGWNKAHNYALPDAPDNAAIRWGTAFEDAIVELAERAQGNKITDREREYSCNAVDKENSLPIIYVGEGEEKNYITCHIDGHYIDNVARPLGILHEGKTTSTFTFRDKWGEPGTDRIPRTYQVQVQHQMLCTGAEEAVVSVLVFPETPDKWEAMGWELYHMDGYGWHMRNNQISPTGIRSNNVKFWAEILWEMGYFHQYPVKANSEAQRLMVEAYREFWHKHVLTGIPPEPRNYEDVKRLFPEPKSTIVVPDYIERKIAEYKGITEETANGKKRKDRLKMIVTKYAQAHIGIEDDESKEAMIFHNGSGDKLGSKTKTKTGSLVFRC
jgi:hypothetical protein